MMSHSTIEDGGAGATNTLRLLTRPSDYSRGGLAVNATPVEEWRAIPGSEEHLISRNGRVWSESKGRELQPHVNSNGYLRVALGAKKLYIHQAVALAYHGVPSSPGVEVRHLNGDPFDNRVENLRWGTSAENKRDIVEHGRNRNARKTQCPNGHDYDYTYGDGRRGCRTCIRASRARNYTPAPPRTHCRRGHEFTPGNTAFTSRGSRTCRTCINDRQRERRSRDRAS